MQKSKTKNLLFVIFLDISVSAKRPPFKSWLEISLFFLHMEQQQEKDLVSKKRSRKDMEHGHQQNVKNADQNEGAHNESSSSDDNPLLRLKLSDYAPLDQGKRFKASNYI